MNYALACIVTNSLFAESREKSKIRCLLRLFAPKQRSYLSAPIEY